jgi:hypothetical protein
MQKSFCQFHRLLAGLLGFAITVVAGSAALARDGSAGAGDGKGRETPIGLDYIPLRGEAVDMAVRSVVLLVNGQAYQMQTKRGLEVKTQDKLPTGGIPILRMFLQPPYERHDFAEERRVGDVAASGTELVIRLSKSMPLPDAVTVLNQSNAFVLDAKSSVEVADVPFTGPIIGGAYFKADDRTLLVMIRPSIVLDGGLF